MTSKPIVTPAPARRSLASQGPVGATLLCIGLVWPAVASAAALFALNNRVARIIIACTMVLIGYRLVREDTRYDAYALESYVLEISSLDASQFVRWVETFCFHSERCIDPAQPFYTFLLTRLSDDPSFAFAGFALVFAIFSLKLATALHSEIDRTAPIFSYFFFFALVLANPIQNIGGFRFNTTSWIFLAGSYLVFFKGRDSAFWLIFVAPFFHYAIAVFAGLAVAIRLISLPVRVAIIVALSSFAISASVQLLLPLLSLEYQIGALARGSRYLSDAAIQSRTEQLSAAFTNNLFYYYYARSGLNAVILGWLCYSLFDKRISNISRHRARFLVFSLLLFSFSNAFSELPSFGRYEAISIQLIFISFLTCLRFYSRAERTILLVLFVPATLFSMVITTRTGLALLDINSLLPTPFLLFERETLW